MDKVQRIAVAELPQVTCGPLGRDVRLQRQKSFDTEERIIEVALAASPGETTIFVNLFANEAGDKSSRVT
ncbi:unnamed protein product [marine sediment metagenome]|uniref:Uncharacterized protein n=1 Tax=marine sediment metagenome TaxID=412755 RepID=X1UC68_9ZZZZ